MILYDNDLNRITLYYIISFYNIVSYYVEIYCIKLYLNIFYYIS